MYDHNIVSKARKTEAVQEMNSKIWRLRRKYAKAIVDELMEAPDEDTKNPTDSDNGGSSEE